MLNRLAAIWLLAALAALALVWWSPSGGWVPPAPLRPDVVPVEVAMPVAAVGSGGEALARPVFWPSRRPQQAVAAANPAGSLDGLEILGVAAQRDNAVLIVNHHGQTLRIVAGQEHAGWRFDRIEGDVAVFERGEREWHAVPIPRHRLDSLPRRPGGG